MTQHNTPSSPAGNRAPSLEFNRVFARGFEVYRRHFKSLTLVSAIGFLPALVFLGLFLGEVLVFSQATLLMSSGLLLLLEAILGLVLYRAAWDSLAGRPLSAGAIWAEVRPRFWATLGTALLVLLGIVIGTMLLIIPGVIMAVISWVAVPVSLIEKKGPIESIERSRELLRGYFWTIFGVIVVIGLFDKLPIRILGKMAENGTLDAGIFFFAILVLAVLTAPLRACLSAAAYAEVLELKQGQDIDAIAQVFGDRADEKLADAPLYAPEDER